MGNYKEVYTAASPMWFSGEYSGEYSQENALRIAATFYQRKSVERECLAKDIEETQKGHTHSTAYMK